MANPENKQIPYESTQQDIRDAIESVATAIGGIAVPSADHVSYDNSVSGLSATDVQNALDEIVSDIPTVNNGTLTIQQNGTSKGSFTANSASNVSVNIETPTADKKTATDQFSTANGGLLSKCMIDLVPVQSGSGDPSPDNVRPISGHTEVDLKVVGKNWCPNRMLTTTKSGITATKNDDGTYTFNGTATAMIDFYMTIPNGTSGDVVDIPDDTYTFSGISGGSNTTYRLYIIAASSPATYYGINSDKANFSSNGYSVNMFLRVYSGAVLNNVVIKPMICLASDSNPTDFEPYLGHLYTINLGGTYYGGYLDVVSGEMIVDRILTTLNGSETYQTNSQNGYTIYNILPSARQFIETECNEFDFVTFNSGLTGIVLGNNSRSLYFLNINGNVSGVSDVDTWKTWLSNNPCQIIIPLDTPQTIQLTPQQIEALVGQNNLSCPLEGQSLETNGTEYKELFTFSDVKELIAEKVPDAPTTDGTYTLTATVSGGVATYSWT